MKTSLNCTCLLLIVLALAVLPGQLAHGQWVGEEYFEGMIPSSEVWDGSFAFGLNGKTGNSESLDINMDLSLNKEDDAAITDFLLTYFYGSDSQGTTVDRVFSEFKQDRKLANEVFTWFYTGSFERDRFKDFDYRLALHTGIGILLLEQEGHSWRSRVGAGASREFGGTMGEWLPELQMGMDWEKKLSGRTKAYANVDFFPNVENFNDYRLNLRTGLETVLDTQLDMRLRSFIFNRYDSTPGAGFDENDLDYGLALVFGF